MATEAQKKAIAKYETEKVDRINCRFPKGIKDRITATGDTVNHFIITAVTEKLEKIESDSPKKGDISAEK